MSIRISVSKYEYKFDVDFFHFVQEAVLRTRSCEIVDRNASKERHRNGTEETAVLILKHTQVL